MRRETKESIQSYLLDPIEKRALRCRNAFSRELKLNKSRKTCNVVIRENLVKQTYLGYEYTFTKRLNLLSFDIAVTDNSGRLKEYMPAGYRYRIKAHLLHRLINHRLRNYFTLCLNNTVYPILSLKDIQFTNTILRIKKDGVVIAWIYYTDIKSLEVL